MKKTIKGLFAFMLAFTMAFSMTGNVFATGTSSLTVNTNATAGQGYSLKDKTIYIFKLFDVAQNGGTYDYTFNRDYQTQLNTALSASHTTDLQFYDAIVQMNETQIQDFADDFTGEVIQPGSVVGTLDDDYYKTTVTDDVTSHTFTNIADGYYLVYLADAADIQSSLVTVAGTAAVNLKTVTTTVEKTADKTNASIGDVVEYTVTTKVPDISLFNPDTYVFTMKDTLSAGLTFVQDRDGTALAGTDLPISIAIGGAAQAAPITGVVAGQNLTVDLAAVVRNAQAANIGSDITLTYYAKVNNQAQITTATGTNTDNMATIEYSNDPSTDTTGETNPSVVNVPTYDLTIRKFSYDDTHLAGATFELYKGSEDPNNLIHVSGDNGSYKVDPDAAGTTIVSADDAIANNYNLRVEGLGAGTYILKETAAPNGYNVLTNNITLVITEDGNNYTLTVDGNLAANNLAEIENKSGTELPSTGGMGTIIFTIGGVAIIGAMATISVVSKKRKQTQD